MVDNTADGLTAEHRARIEAALPPGKVMTPEAWAELEEIIVGYRIFETRPRTYPIVEERKRWKRLGEAVDTGSLAELRRETLWTDPDPTWRDRALTMLSEVRRKVEARAPPFTRYGAAFSRRQNPHREFLYWGVMWVWTDRLGGELRYSNSPERIAERSSGPFPRGLCRAYPGRQDAGCRDR